MAPVPLQLVIGEATSLGWPIRLEVGCWLIRLDCDSVPDTGSRGCGEADFIFVQIVLAIKLREETFGYPRSFAQNQTAQSRG